MLHKCRLTYVRINNATAADVSAMTSVLKSETGFRASSALVVPVNVPSELPVEVRLKDASLGDIAAYSVHGALMQGGNTLRNLPPAAFSIQNGEKNGQIKIQFSVQELRNYIADNAHGKVSVVLTLHSRSDDSGKEAQKVSFDIQSPPSELSQAMYIPASLYEKTKKITLPSEFRRVRLLNGGILYLVGVVEFTNNDAQGFMVGVPFKLPHEFNLVSRMKSVSVSECGNQPSEAVSRTKLDSNLRMIPFGANIDAKAAAAAASGDSQVFLAKGTSTQVGIYSMKPDLLTVPQSNITMRSVPFQCVARCNRGAEGDWADRGKWGDSCIECGNASGNEGTSCYNCRREHSSWCRWQDWSAWAQNTNVATGSSFELEIMPDEKSAPSQYALSYRGQSVAPRMLRVLTDKLIVTETYKE